MGITLALLEHGYRVVANSRTISKSKELHASKDLVLVDGDISKKETAARVADAAIKHLAALISSSTTRHLPAKPFTEYTPEDFETMIATNIAGYSS